MRIVSFGDVTLPQFNGLQQLPVPFRSAVVPLRGGGFDQDGVNSFLETKMVSANFWVRQDDGNVDTIIDNLYKEAGMGRRLLVATMRDNTTQRQQYAKLVNASTKPDSRVYAIDSSGLECYEVVQAQWEIVYPYWELETDFALLLDDGHVLDDGLSLDDGNEESESIATTSTSHTITNNSNTKIEKVLIWIWGKSAGGTISNITIENTTTGEKLTWTGTIVEDDILLIDSLAQTITFNYLNAYEDTELGSNQIGFFTLEIGDNNFLITGDNVTVGARIFWSWHTHFIR